MTGRKSREEIELFANTILKRYNMYGIPVDTIVLANKMGINVKNGNFSDPSVSGMIHKKGEKVELCIKVSDELHKQRFTVAHELGHVVLHLNDLDDGDHPEQDINILRRNSNIKFKYTNKYVETAEKEANQFAAALLMDEELVRAMWGKFPSLEDIADAFGVPKEAMAYRLGNLDL